MTALIITLLLGFGAGLMVGWYWHGKTIKIALRISENFLKVFGGSPPIAEIISASEEAEKPETEVAPASDLSIDFGEE